MISRGAATLTMAAAVVLAVACLYTEYYPVMNCRMALADALFRLDQREFHDAEPKAALAAEADSLSPEPWRLLGDLKLARWQVSGDPKDWRSFEEVADMFRKLNPRHHLAWYTRGNWYLTAWKKSGSQKDLEEALGAYTQASAHFPNRALYHAQLAWVLHLAGQASLAQQEAEIAYTLDQKMPHKEQKLARQHVTDPEVTKEKQAVFREETAEQTVERLRSASTEEKP